MLRSKFVPAHFYLGYFSRTNSTNAQAFQSTKFIFGFPCNCSASRRMTNIGRSRSQFSTTSLKSSPEQSIEYHWIDGVERLEMYEPGGYHPVMVDDLLHNRYRIVDKLGYGGYSTIWLARDETAKRCVAVKIGISSPSSPRREIEVLRALESSRPGSYAHADSDLDTCAALPSVLDAFDIHGPNGTHACYTLTPAQGSLKEAAFCRLFPIKVARALAAGLATAVASVHSRGFVHGDISLRNVLVRLPSMFEELSVEEFRKKFGEPEMIPIARVDEKPLTPNVPAKAALPLYLGKKADKFTMDDACGLILSDFGEAFSPATERRLGRNCNISLVKRAPEAYFEPDKPLSYPSDIWSLGLAIWEILGMKFVFSNCESLDEIVAEEIDVLGYHNFPQAWKSQWERSVNEKDQESDMIPRRPADDRETWPSLEDAFEEFVQKYRRSREAAGAFEERETQAIIELMRGMLKFSPEERLSIEEVLESKWMVNWALPQLAQGSDVSQRRKN